MVVCLLALIAVQFQPQDQPTLVAQTGSWMVRSAILSPDRRLIAMVNGGNATVEAPSLWEMESRRQIRKFQGPDSPIDSLELDIDAGCLVGLTRKSTLTVWNLVDGRVKKTVPNVVDMFVATGGVRFLSGPKLYSLDLATSEIRPLWSLPADNNRSGMVDGEQLWTWSKSEGLSIWREGKVTLGPVPYERAPGTVASITKSLFLVNSPLFSLGADGTPAQAPGFDRALVAFTKSDPLVKGLNDHLGGVSVQKDRVYVPRKDGFDECFESKGDLVTKFHPLPAGDYFQVLFAGDASGQLYAIGSDWVVRFDQATDKVVSKIPIPEDQSWMSTTDYTWCSGPNLFLAASSVNEPALVNLDTCKVVDQLVTRIVPPSFLAVMPSAGWLLARSEFGEDQELSSSPSLRFNLGNGSVVRDSFDSADVVPFTDQTDSESEVLLHLDDELVAYSFVTGKSRIVYKNDVLKDVDFDTFVGNVAIGTDSDLNSYVIDPAPGNIHKDPIAKGAMTRLFYSEGSDYFFMAAEDKTFRIDTRTGDGLELESLPFWQGPEIDEAVKANDSFGVTSVDFIGDSTPDGEWLALGTVVTAITVKSQANMLEDFGQRQFASVGVLATKGKRWQRLDTGPSKPISVCVSPLSREAFVGCLDGKVMAFDLATAKKSREVTLNSPVSQSQFDPVTNIVWLLLDNRVTAVDPVSLQTLGDLYFFRDGGWAVVAPDGRFDTNDLYDVNALCWVMPDDPFTPLSLEAFMKDFYTPGLLAQLVSNDRGATPTGASQLMSRNRVQPLVEISEAVIDSAGMATVKVTLKSVERAIAGKLRQSGAMSLRLFRNGQLVAGSESFPEKSGQNGAVLLDSSGTQQFVFSVPVPTSDSDQNVEFSAYAFNSDGVRSRLSKAMCKVPKEVAPQPRRAFLIHVGVNTYATSSLSELAFAAQDAKTLHKEIGPRLVGFKSVQSSLLVAETGLPGATKAEFKRCLDVLAGKVPAENGFERARPGDLVLVTWSGHGAKGLDDRFYLFPSDSASVTDRTTAVSSDELSEWMRDIDAGDIVIVIDACQSANAVEGNGFKPGPLDSRGLGQMAFDKGMVVLAATQSTDVAIESGVIQSGLLSYAMAKEGLIEARAGTDGRTSLGEWLDWSARRVPLLYRDLRDGKFRGAENSGRPTANVRRSQTPRLFDFHRSSLPIYLKTGN